MSISKVISGTASLLREYTYNNNDGTVSTMKDHTGEGGSYILKIYGYDGPGLVVSIVSTKNGNASEVLESYAYTYDKQ